MSSEQHVYWGRREFLGRAMLAGTAGLVGLQSARLIADLLGSQSRVTAAEPPPETTTIRLIEPTSVCQAPLYVAEEFLRDGEGFSQEGFGRLGVEYRGKVV